MFLVCSKITHLHRIHFPGLYDTGKGHLPINFQGEFSNPVTPERIRFTAQFEYELCTQIENKENWLLTDFVNNDLNHQNPLLEINLEKNCKWKCQGIKYKYQAVFLSYSTIRSRFVHGWVCYVYHGSVCVGYVHGYINLLLERVCIHMDMLLDTLILCKVQRLQPMNGRYRHAVCTLYGFLT